MRCPRGQNHPAKHNRVAPSNLVGSRWPLQNNLHEGSCMTAGLRTIARLSPAPRPIRSTPVARPSGFPSANFRSCRTSLGLSGRDSPGARPCNVSGPIRVRVKSRTLCPCRARARRIWRLSDFPHRYLQHSHRARARDNLHLAPARLHAFSRARVSDPHSLREQLHHLPRDIPIDYSAISLGEPHSRGCVS